MTDAMPRISQWSRTLCLAFTAMVGALVTLVAGGMLASPAQAHCVGSAINNTQVKLNDRFRNFDYNSTGDGDCNVDWPMDFLFHGNASKFIVKNRMGSIGYDHEGSPKHGKLDDSAGWDWNTDRGRKTYDAWDACFGDLEHFRIYAVYTDNQMYNVDWGYYVLGTAHIDHHEAGGCPGTWWGESEKAEGRIANSIQEAGAIGLGEVREDQLYFDNFMAYAVAEDGHHKWNSGWATKVLVRP